MPDEKRAESPDPVQRDLDRIDRGEAQRAGTAREARPLFGREVKRPDVRPARKDRR